MERFVQALQSFGIGRLAAILGVSAAVAAGLFMVAFNIGNQADGLLYSNMDPREAASVAEALDQAGIKYKAVGDGTTIKVPRDQVGEARMKISGQGLMTSGSVGYELFDQNTALGQTDYVTKLNRQRAMEGELARTIRSMKGVTFARVGLNLPQRQHFEEEAQAPSASVLVGSGRPLDPEQVRSVQNLIAGVVSNLKPDAVAVVDQATGRTIGGGGESEDVGGALAAERRVQAEESLKKKVRELVEGVVGPGKAKILVTAELDLSRVTVQQEQFDPDGQVARSTSNVSVEASEGEAGEVGGEVTTSNNLPGGDAGVAVGGTSSNNNRTEETSNFEISKTTRTEVIEPGAIKKLSVGVALDGVPEPVRAQIEGLVRASLAIGSREGDTLQVTSAPFAKPPEVKGAESKSMLAAFDKNDIMRGAELGVLAIVAALIIFFVVRPLLKTAGGGGGLVPMPMLAGAPAGGGGTMQVAGSGPTAAQIPYEAGSSQMLQIPAPQEDSRIDMARIEGQVRTSSIKQVSEFVERHPEESVSIIRSWLHEG